MKSDGFENPEKIKFVSKYNKDEIGNVISGKSKTGDGEIIQTIAQYIRRNEDAISLAKQEKYYKNKEAAQKYICDTD